MLQVVVSFSNHFMMTLVSVTAIQTGEIFGIRMIMVALKHAGMTCLALGSINNICQDISLLFHTFFEPPTRYVVRSNSF